MGQVEFESSQRAWPITTTSAWCGNMMLIFCTIILRVAMHGKVSTDPQGTSDLDECPSPRIMVTHLPWRYLPQAVKDGKVKVRHYNSYGLLTLDLSCILSCVNNC